MERTQRPLGANDTTNRSVLYMAMELSNKKWKLAFSNGEKARYVTVEARELSELEEAVSRTRRRLAVDEDVRIVSCFEAGRDGFWIHRYLDGLGIANVVVDPSSIEVSRRKRQAKTDRIDVNKLLRLLIRHHAGEPKVWSVVHVPNVEDEDERRMHRERSRLKKEITGHSNRISSLLVLHGIVLESQVDAERLAGLRCWDGSPLPPNIEAELRRELERLQLAKVQLDALEKERVRLLEEVDTPKHRSIAQLMRLKGIGVTSAWLLVQELFGWRKFNNRRELAAMAGLVPVPWASGDISRDQGISKSGNRRVRRLLVEISWLWLRYQPHSDLTRWFNERFAEGGKRMRRIGIVAVARKLLIILWRFLEHGEVPENVVLKPV